MKKKVTTKLTTLKISQPKIARPNKVSKWTQKGAKKSRKRTKNEDQDESTEGDASKKKIIIEGTKESKVVIKKVPEIISIGKPLLFKNFKKVI